MNSKPTRDLLAHDVQASFCAVLVDEWIRQGLRYAAIAPGSRSTPMALALMQAREENPGFLVDVFHDERSAAFAALGSGLVSGLPAIALCTSGTAAAHFHAAVIEADLSAVPMIACTADRPPELRDVGAPQTIDQTKLFGNSVRWFHDPGVPVVEAASTWRSLAARSVWAATSRPPGPVHLNLPFREPLVGRVDAGLFGASSPSDPSQMRERVIGNLNMGDSDGAEFARLVSDRPGVIIAGRGCGHPASVETLANALGWPVFAEPRAGCGAGAHTVLHADALVRVPEIVQALRPEVVLRLGEPPASKALAQWVVASGARQIHVTSSGKFFDPDHQLNLRLEVDVDSLVEVLLRRCESISESNWLSRWKRADDAVRAILSEFDTTSSEWSGLRAARAIVRAMPAGSHVVVSSSMPIRDVEWFAGDCSHLTVHANRGANGIDGVIATATGVARTSGAPTFVVVGDVAAIHDASTLLSGASTDADLRIVILNNDGGGIFHHLPQATTVEASTFEAIYGTPHGIDFAGLATALGYAAFDISGQGDDLSAALRASGPSVIQIRTDRSRDVDEHRLFHSKVSERIHSDV